MYIQDVKVSHEDLLLAISTKIIARDIKIYDSIKTTLRNKHYKYFILF